MLVIRLRRLGAKKRPFFRIVVTESGAPHDSRAVDALGFYDPRSQPEALQLDRNRLAYWIEKGARPSSTIRTLIARHPAPPETPAGASDSEQGAA